MAMGPTMWAATALSGLNVLLLLVVTGVWLRNYRTFESPLTLGLVAFGATLLLENAVAIYFFFSSSALYAMDPGVQTTVAAMRALQFLALAFLSYVSMK
jgi:hypothetical protein